MPETFGELIIRLKIDAEQIAKATGVSDRTARSWLANEKHAPETARRIILMVYDGVPPESFK